MCACASVDQTNESSNRSINQPNQSINQPINQPHQHTYIHTHRHAQVAEVATLVGSAALYYKLATDAGSRAKMQRYAPFVMDAFHQVTGGRYQDGGEDVQGPGGGRAAS